MLTNDDLLNLQHRGISAQQVAEQLKCFETGFPYLSLQAAATPGNGITVLTSEQEHDAIKRWDRYLASGGEVIKMVPASGAASRMFKAMFEFADGDTDSTDGNKAAEEVLDHIDRFAFFDDLNAVLIKTLGKDVDKLLKEGRNRDIIKGIISPEGLNYGNLPKGLLKFHAYSDGHSRTPLEEQLAEGAQMARTADGKVRVHFTVSADHRDRFNAMLAEVLPELEHKTGLRYEVTLSEQKPSTDTIAANDDNTPFRDDSGALVFRPGGHGALIQNLNDLDAAVVFIKNIDNVVPDHHRKPTVHYKRVLGGYLMEIHDQVAAITAELKTDVTHERLAEIADYLTKTFCIKFPANLDDNSMKGIIIEKLNRPIRVCGMVRNEGEPGGGPYVVNEPDGTTSLQILESTQIDKADDRAVAMMQQSTHFNPVDLVCYIKDVDGQKFNLPDYVDPSTGFISSKSLHGKSLKALELPGLWNGAMSRWLTAMIEVPVSTFNPVKTINDLLRPAHQQA
ncbi:MAG: DUF4301 family protein [Muribaculaceae bacterium]|nr:DUF4301 family protein [Muribaculaceae bacterium]